MRNDELPQLQNLRRLMIRQSLSCTKYVLSIHFGVFYDVTPITRGGQWSTSCFGPAESTAFLSERSPPVFVGASEVGQSIEKKNRNVDSVTDATMCTCIDNVTIAAKVGKELVLVAAVRPILRRIRQTNLLMSPVTQEPSAKTNDKLPAAATIQQMLVCEGLCEAIARGWRRTPPKQSASPRRHCSFV
jgi:hypothetical protein